MQYLPQKCSVVEVYKAQNGNNQVPQNCTLHSITVYLQPQSSHQYFLPLMSNYSLFLSQAFVGKCIFSHFLSTERVF